MNVLGVIPARLDSTRLPKKLIRKVCGKPLIQYVYENVKKASCLSDVIVACDDQEIVDVVEGFGGEALLTSVNHQSGTERIHEIAQKIKADIYVNIQGDEPLMDPQSIDSLVQNFKDEPEFLVATLAVKKTDEQEYLNPNAVKVVFDQAGKALCFSRSSLPHFREAGAEVVFWKHLGIYAYRAEFMSRFAGLKESFLEKSEKLEQLRFLDNGISIKVIETEKDSIGVDTEEDLQIVEKILSTTVG